MLTMIILDDNKQNKLEKMSTLSLEFNLILLKSNRLPILYKNNNTIEDNVYLWIIMGEWGWYLI